MKNTFEDLKQFMNHPIYNIEDWNEKREKAKELFQKELINRLDASGFVKKVMKKKRKRTIIKSQ